MPDNLLDVELHSKLECADKGNHIDLSHESCALQGEFNQHTHLKFDYIYSIITYSSN